jgi:hypothetical protein
MTNTSVQPSLQNLFVSNRLKVERMDGDDVYTLNQQSVSPVIELEISDDGVSIEQTIMTLAKSAKFVDRGGNVCDVALRTGRVLSNETGAASYEQYMMVDLIRGGQVPLAACPNTVQFSYIKPNPDGTGRPHKLIKDSEGEDCGGLPSGCPHIWKLIDKRRAAVKKRIAAEAANIGSMTKEQAEAMASSFGAIAGDAIRQALGDKGSIKTARKGLQGPGEPDEVKP